MTVYFVSRHAGAVAWAKSHGLEIDIWVRHLAVEQVRPGDIVAGTLPIQLAAAVCGRNASYLHLVVDLPAHWRGRELTEADLNLIGARLEPFEVARGCRPPAGRQA